MDPAPHGSRALSILLEYREEGSHIWEVFMDQAWKRHKTPGSHSIGQDSVLRLQLAAGRGWKKSTCCMSGKRKGTWVSKLKFGCLGPGVVAHNDIKYLCELAC